MPPIGEKQIALVVQVSDISDGDPAVGVAGFCRLGLVLQVLERMAALVLLHSLLMTGPHVSSVLRDGNTNDVVAAWRALMLERWLCTFESGPSAGTLTPGN